MKKEAFKKEIDPLRTENVSKEENLKAFKLEMKILKENLSSQKEIIVEEKIVQTDASVQSARDLLIKLKEPENQVTSQK